MRCVVVGETRCSCGRGSCTSSAAGFEVVAQAGDAEDLVRNVPAHKPDVAVVDIRMPPTETDDGLRAAMEIRRRLPETGVMVLSQYLDEAMRSPSSVTAQQAPATCSETGGRRVEHFADSVPSGRADLPSTRRSSSRCWVAAAATTGCR